MMGRKVRHILGVSGGKDSAALAVYLKDRIPNIEYFFCDTGYELPETYRYLNRLEAFLGKKIVRLNNDGRTFDHYLTIYGNYLPSPQARWCTRHLKLEPMERFIGDDRVFTYVAIRADEERDGYKTTRSNITPVFPFVEDGIRLHDVIRILDSVGLGLPDYYNWRSRSGCYFCFFQSKIEWVHLKEEHPELFEKAKTFEKKDPKTDLRYTWNEGESLEELAQPERIEEIKRNNSDWEPIQPKKSKSLVGVLDEYGML